MTMDHLRIGGVGLVSMEYGSDVLVTPGALDNFYLLQIPIKGQAAIRFGKQDFAVTAGQASVQHPDEALEMHWGASCEKIVLRLDRHRFERFVEQATGRAQKRGLRLQPKMDMTGTSGRMIIEHIKAGLACAAQFPANMVPPLVATHLETAFMSALLYLHPHDRTEEFASMVMQGEGRVVTYVRNYLETHADQPIDMAMLAQSAGVPLRTLYHVFQRSVGITPMQLLRDIRLDRVRECLLAGGSERTVTSVALDWGFDHLGRFAMNYRRRFGESPSETLRRGTGRPL